MVDPVPAPAEQDAARAFGSLARQRGAAGRRRRRRWPWVLALVLLLAGAVAWWQSRAAPVQVTSVVTSYPSLQYAQLTASGYVVAQRRAAVSSKGTGRLVELNVREGSVVRQGELIARLDASDVQASLMAARAAVSQAEASARQAAALVRQAEVDAENAQGQLARVQGLAAQGFVSPQAVDDARSRAAAAAAARDAALAGQRTAQAGVAQANALVEVQQVGREATEIRAPFDGVVLVKNANVGDMITPFSSASGTLGAVVTMADMGTLEVEADVSESNVAKIAAGQPVEITLDAIPDARFRGTVGRIVPTVDRAKATVMTKVRFEKLDARVLPEMSAKVTFLSKAPSDAEQRPVLAANPKAVVERDGRRVVLRVREGETVEVLPVQVGRKLGDTVEIAGAGLQSADRLVLAPPDALKDGGRIAIAAK